MSAVCRAGISVWQCVSVGAGAGGGVSDRDGAVDRTFPEEKIAGFAQCFQVVSVPPAFIDAAKAALADPGAHAESQVFER